MNKGLLHNEKNLERLIVIIDNGEDEKMQEKGICTLFAIKTKLQIPLLSNKSKVTWYRVIVELSIYAT